MDREIKFRAWQLTHKYMTVDVTMIQDEKSTDFFYGNPEDGISMRKDWELMQLTGLKDKNGKEVYEGDIVNNSVASWIVKFNKGCFCGDMIKPNPVTADTLIALRAIRDIFVIGNIHENPELLK